MNPYDDCVYCGGKVEEKIQTMDYRYHGQLFIIENVLAGVCMQCGERYLKAEVAKKLEKAVSSAADRVKTVAIPVISMAA